MKEIYISHKEEGQRVDKFVRRYFSDAPLSFIYKLFRIKDVKVNNKPVKISYILKADDVLKIYVSDEQIQEFVSSRPLIRAPINLKIVYEDENVLIIYKPKGILVHGDEKEKRLTLANQVLNYLYNKGEYDYNSSSFVPSPAHRLDRNTSGIVCFGKNMESLQELYELFKTHVEIHKEYIALLEGRLKKDGTINLPLKKDEKKGLAYITPLAKGGKEAITKYMILENYIDKTLVKAELITGRFHQLRAHFKAIGYPICGDTKYGDFEKNKIFSKTYQYKSQFLYATSLSFGNLNGKLKYLSNHHFEVELEQKEEDILTSLREQKACIRV